MTAPENTRDVPAELHLLGMIGNQSGYIEEMERDGQRQLVNSTSLPADGPWDELTALGFTKGEPVDDLFVNATLPQGWIKEGSDHAMWSYLCDERGIQRVGVFYKAAFYDRKAHMSLQNVGYSASTESLYGDTAALPAKWTLFTADERASFVAGLDGMDENIREAPSIYGKYSDRLAAVRVLVEAAS